MILPPREQHVAVVYQNSIFVFGGKLNDMSNTIYSDFWKLEIESYISINQNFITNNTMTKIDQSSRNLYPIDTLDMSDPYQDIHQATYLREDARNGACITDLRVTLSFYHSCVQQLRISLIGPGLLTGSPNFHAATFENEVMLFDQRRANSSACTTGNFTLIFDDNALNKTENCCSEAGLHVFHPEGKLAEFVSTTPRAIWSLMIEDMTSDAFSGVLYDWNIDFDLRPCNRRYSWTPIPTSVNAPSARYKANAVVHNTSMFIFGGKGDGDMILSDLFRYNFATGIWVELTPVNFDIALTTSSMVGYSLAMTTWGLIRFGGYYRLPSMSATYQSYTNDVFVLDPVTLHWKKVDYFQSTVQPIGRYLSSIVFIPSSSLNWRTEFSYRILYDKKIQSKYSNFAGSMSDSIFFFGGQSGATGSIKDGSTGGMLNDMWSMRFSNWSISANRAVQNDYQSRYCERTKFNSYSSTCFDGMHAPCELRELLLLSWCSNENQTIS